MRHDVIVDEVRRVREELVRKYGGLDGWIQHLQAMDRERARKPKRPTDDERVPPTRKRRRAISSKPRG
jgi:hypothetical protein